MFALLWAATGERHVNVLFGPNVREKSEKSSDELHFFKYSDLLKSYAKMSQMQILWSQLVNNRWKRFMESYSYFASKFCHFSQPLCYAWLLLFQYITGRSIARIIEAKSRQLYGIANTELSIFSHFPIYYSIFYDTLYSKYYCKYYTILALEKVIKGLILQYKCLQS